MRCGERTYKVDQEGEPGGRAGAQGAPSGEHANQRRKGGQNSVCANNGVRKQKPSVKQRNNSSRSIYSFT